MPSVTRKGDLNSGHGGFSPSSLISGSPTVYINNLPCGRKSDSYSSHSDGNSTHSGSVSGGSPTVFVEGLPIARVGDSVSCGGTVAQGSPNVYAN